MSQSEHSVNTGQWILEKDVFKEWLNGKNRILWCPGIPGAGKTVLASVIINFLESYSKQNNVGLAFIYCNHKERQTQTASNLIASLLEQLVRQQPNPPDTVTALYNDYFKKRTRPSFTEYLNLFQSVINNLFDDVFVVIDALDEYMEEDGSRDKLLAGIQRLQPNIHLLVTSRWLLNIEREFEKSIRLEIRATDEDITKYLDGRIQKEKRLRNHVKEDPFLRNTIVNTIVGNSRGMFLLAQLHIDSLAKKPHRKAIRQALNHLPKGLDDTYNEAMQRIGCQDKEDVDLAYRTLSWISFALRPLTIKEIQHALAVEPDQGNIENESLIDEDLLVSVCAGLVTIDQESDIIRLVHFTTEEYFKHTRLQHFPDAQQKISEACITYLSFDIFDEGYCSTNKIFEDKLCQNPFLDYAAKYWGHHIRGNTEKVVEQSVLRFLSSKGKVSGASQVLLDNGYRYRGYIDNIPILYGIHLITYFGLKDILAVLLEMEVDVEAKDSHGWTALHWSVRNGYEPVVRLLVEKGADVNAQGGDYDNALYAASFGGHEQIVQLLLEKGADVNAQGGYYGNALYAASLEGHEQIVQLLLEKGADVNAQGGHYDN